MEFGSALTASRSAGFSASLASRTAVEPKATCSIRLRSFSSAYTASNGDTIRSSVRPDQGRTDVKLARTSDTGMPSDERSESRDAASADSIHSFVIRHRSAGYLESTADRPPRWPLSAVVANAMSNRSIPAFSITPRIVSASSAWPASTRRVFPSEQRSIAQFPFPTSTNQTSRNAGRPSAPTTGVEEGVAVGRDPCGPAPEGER